MIAAKTINTTSSTLTKSINTGTTFNNIVYFSSANYRNAAISLYGTHIYLVQSGSKIYKSTDGGTSWSTLSGTTVENYTDISCSSDGKYVTATYKNNITYSGNSIVYSNDYGSTWTTDNPVSGKGYSSVYVTNSGFPQLVTNELGTYIYKRNSSGSTFSAITAAGDRVWRNAVVSNDGKYYLATTVGDTGGPTNPQAYLSTDSGTTWNLITGITYSSGVPTNCSISSSGQYMIFTQSSLNGIWVSSDYGSTWIKKVTTACITNSVISNNGQIMAVANSCAVSGFHISTDYGVTWSANTATSSNTNFISINR